MAIIGKVFLRMNPSIPPSFALRTFGCKLNQFDSFVLADQLQQQGWVRDKLEDANMIILNSCAVTHRAEADLRREIRRLHRVNPQAQIAVTGCLAEIQRERLQQEHPELRFVWGNQDKYNIHPLLQSLSNGKKPSLARDNIFRQKKIDFHPVTKFGDQARALVKVQDGCDLRCSYCIVPFTRGNSRSLPEPIILDYLYRLEDAGYPEAVLTGIHIGHYRGEHGSSLEELLRFLEQSRLSIKIRLSSLDSNELTPGLLDFLATSRLIQPHLHIPLQSGSDTILARMRRHHRKKDFLKCMQKLRSLGSHWNFGSDIIVGFPGETEADFQQSYQVLAESELNYAHIFSFSERNGTKAAAMPNKITAIDKKERSQALRSLSHQKQHQFISRQDGQIRSAIVIQKVRSDKGHAITQTPTAEPQEPVATRTREESALWQVLTDNYLQLTAALHPQTQQKQSIFIKILSPERPQD